MTKAAELAIVDEAIGKLGRDSYLGPWLASVRHELADCIRSDYYPAPMLPWEAYREAERIQQATAQQAAETKALAEKRSAEIVGKARQQADNILARVHGDLRAALKRLEGDV